MNRFTPLTYLLVGVMLLAQNLAGRAQSPDVLKIQVHGFATQSVIYTTHNSWDTTNSEHVSAAWNETALNVSSQPDPRLRIGVQARFFLLGDYGKKLSLDWAQADLKLSEKFGLRGGKVKTPSGLFNEDQDIDPAHLWILLPQSIYPLASRTTLLSIYGGVFYGAVPIGEHFGKLEYRALGGSQSIPSDDGVLQPERDHGFAFPDGLAGKIYGGSLRWRAPLTGLLLGASTTRVHETGKIVDSGLSGHFDTGRFFDSWYFVSYDRAGWMLAGEYNHLSPDLTFSLNGLPPLAQSADLHAWYLMLSRRFGPKLNLGAYYTANMNLRAPLDGNRYQKDWTISSRYDLSPYLYLKLEQHVVNGTQIGFSSLDNPDLKTKFNMSLLKFGVTF